MEFTELWPISVHPLLCAPHTSTHPYFRALPYFRAPPTSAHPLFPCTPINSRTPYTCRHPDCRFAIYLTAIAHHKLQPQSIFRHKAWDFDSYRCGIPLCQKSILGSIPKASRFNVQVCTVIFVGSAVVEDYQKNKITQISLHLSTTTSSYLAIQNVIHKCVPKWMHAYNHRWLLSYLHGSHFL